MATLFRAGLLLCFSYLAMVVMYPASAASSTRVQSLLKRLNKPAINTIHSPDGDIIDCIAIDQQPAFDHPLLKNHTVQMKPAYIPEGPFSENVEEEQRPPAQLWHQTRASCPDGTIPVRRTTEQDLLRTQSGMNTYGRKFHGLQKSSASDKRAGHEYAVSSMPDGGKYYGTKFTINVQTPTVQIPGEFSLSQVWIIGGPLETIEAGWQVYPGLYGDNNTRLFVYWTNDGYDKTGCYNLLCSGFVQVSKDIVLGATITHISSIIKSDHRDITFFIWKDPKQGNWWLKLDNKYVVGYWPKKLYSTLSTSSNLVEWGGEIVNLKTGGHHTTTNMGSGYFPRDGFGKSSYFSHLHIVNSKHRLEVSRHLTLSVTNPSCYNIQSDVDHGSGTYFLYGGPGKNYFCP